MLAKILTSLGVAILLAAAAVGLWTFLKEAPESQTKVFANFDQKELQIYPEAWNSGPMDYLVFWRLREGEAELLWVLDSQENPELKQDTHTYTLISWGVPPQYAAQRFPEGGGRPKTLLPGDSLVVFFGFWEGPRGKRRPAAAAYQFIVSRPGEIQLVREWTHQFIHNMPLPIPLDHIPEPIRNAMQNALQKSP